MDERTGMHIGDPKQETGDKIPQDEVSYLAVLLVSPTRSPSSNIFHHQLEKRDAR